MSTLTRFITRNGKRIEVETLDTTPRQKKSETRRAEEFAKVPLLWAAEMVKVAGTRGAMVLILLPHLAWKARSTTFSFSNATTARLGISRYTKYRVLKKLETAGLIKVEWRYKTVADRYLGADSKNEDYLITNHMTQKSVAYPHIPSGCVAYPHMSWCVNAHDWIRKRTCGPVLFVFLVYSNRSSS